MFVTKEEYESMTLEKLNEICEKIRNSAIEGTLKLLPDVIMGLAIKSKGTDAAVEMFKAAHPDLAARKDELMQAMLDIEAEDTTLSLPEILDKVPKRMKNMFTEIPEEQPHTIIEAERCANGFI